MADKFVALREEAKGRPLFGHGTELFTKRVTGIDTDGSAITLGVDCKSVMVHVESGTQKLKITGTVATSAAVYLTESGYSWEDIPIVRTGTQTLFTLAAPTGTIDVSIFAWR